MLYAIENELFPSTCSNKLSTLDGLCRKVFTIEVPAGHPFQLIGFITGRKIIRIFEQLMLREICFDIGDNYTSTVINV